MSTFGVDINAVYERTAEVVERALVVDPETGFSLEDIESDQQALAGMFLSNLIAPLIVEGALTGCLAALHQFDTAPALVASITSVPDAPGGVVIDPDQFQTVIDWLKQSVSQGLNDGARSALINPVVAQDPDVTRRTGYVLALVVVADIVCSAARN